ncbi:MAG: helix-turn-helix domain-containing protein [Candidatus Caldarchaeum sp.]|nr:helix-turn-helix domain-containing protein [Candidatus Caldarchaeum sp.]
MAPSRLSKLWMAVSLTAGVVILSTALSIWQHEMMMGGMMPHMVGMMWWVYLPFAVAALVLITLPIAVYFSSGSQSARVVGLTAEEKAVVEYLTRSGGEAEQKEIAKALGYSRLKTHRLIASLRRRNIVEVKPHGRTNLVKLHETSRNP